MKLINYNFERTFKLLGIKTRPNASSGYWVSFLLPISLIISYFRNPETSSTFYKYTTFISAGFIISNIIIIIQCVRNNEFKSRTGHILTAIYTSSLFYTCLYKSLPFSIFTGLLTICAYIYGVPWLLKSCPQSFTFGEASVIVQGAILFLYTSILNISDNFIHTPMKVCQIATIILQIGITGLMLICFISYKLTFFRKTIPFYVLTISTLLLWVSLLLHVILQGSPLLWIYNLLTRNISTVKMMSFWITCFTMAVMALIRQIQSGKKANTITRKTFHLLVVLVMLPGLIDQCPVLYLATGVVLAVLIALETLRLCNVAPFGGILQDGFTVFKDEKDAGLAMTPIYLLVGCSLPIWIHPEPCDVTDSAGFQLLPLISGLLTVGIGDTLASVCGKMFGKRKWIGTDKTIEGTLACIFGQLVTVILLMNFGFILKTNENIIRALLAAIISSIVEAKTNQVDNLVLPLISYIILV